MPSDISKVFVIGDKYSRSDIYILLSIPTELQGGDWNTGYHKHNGVWFIFTTIAEEGRTGHNYANSFSNNNFIWFGKNGSKIDHPSIQDLINPNSQTLLFSRERNRELFVYKGNVEAEKIKDQVPVEVLWTFSDIDSNNINNDSSPNKHHEDKMTTTNPTVSKLLEQSIGGEDAICLMGKKESNAFVSPSPAGVRDAVDGFADALTGADTKNVEILFLIGGAGNGKSYELARFLAELDTNLVAVNKSKKLERIFLDESLSPNIFIINDATIVEYENDIRHDLIYDLNKLFKAEKRTFLFANINRGVLIEDINHASEESVEYSNILEWVLADYHSDFPNIKPISSSSKYFKRAEIIVEESGYKYFLNAVYLDQLSLLEPTPKLQGRSICDPCSLSPTTADYRLNGPNDSRIDSPIGILLNKLIDESNFDSHESCSNCSAKSLCPFLANVQNLRNRQFQEGFLYLLRAIETNAGQLFSYREVWDNLSLALIGRCRQSWIDNSQSPCEWVRAKTTNVSGEKQIFELFFQRIHTSLFPISDSNITNSFIKDKIPQDWVVSDSNPLIERNGVVDPALATDRGWQRKIFDAMESINYRDFPSEICSKDKRFESVWCRIDSMVEKEIVHHHQTSLEIDRHLLRWFTTTLTRFWGLIDGVVNYNEVVHHFINLKRLPEYADSSNPLNLGIMNMLTNASGTSQMNYYPLYHPRTRPLQPGSDVYNWCVGVPNNAYQISLSSDGEELWIALYSIKKRKEISKILVDFKMAKELYFNSQGEGFTDQGHQISPRLERTWAQILNSSIQAEQLYLVQSESQIIVID